MGIDTHIRRWLAELATPHAFQGDALPLKEHPRGWVYVVDILTVLHRLRGPRFDGTFTGEELFQHAIQPYLRRLGDDSNFVCVVLCADDYTRVPKEKLETQQKRHRQFTTARAKAHKAQRQALEANTPASAASDASEPGAPPASAALEQLSNGVDVPCHGPEFRYPRQSTIDDNGIHYIDVDGQEHHEAIDLALLLRSRSAVTVLWAYVAQRLRQNTETASLLRPALPIDRLLVLDHGSTGPLFFSGNRHGRLPPEKAAEGELQSFFWSRVFAPHPTVLDTVDTDLLPIALGDETLRRRPAPLYWRYPGRESGQLEHLCLTRASQDLPISPLGFRALCVMCGTDFFAKKMVLHQVGAETLLTAALYAEPHLVAAATGDGSPETMSHFLWFLRAAYALKTPNWSVDSSDEPPTLDDLERTLTARSKVYRFPSPADCQEAMARVQWNCGYWSMDRLRHELNVYGKLHLELTRLPTLPEAPPGEDDTEAEPTDGSSSPDPAAAAAAAAGGSSS